MAHLCIAVVLVCALAVVACGDKGQPTTEPTNTASPATVDAGAPEPGEGAGPAATRATTPAVIPSPLPLDVVSAVEVVCFQGFCVESEPGTGTVAKEPPGATGTVVPSVGGISEQPPPLPSVVQTCLIDSLGRDIVRQLFEGQRLPSVAELETLESCRFAPIPSLAPGGSTVGVSPGAIEALERCLIEALGEGTYADITGGVRRPTAEETGVFAKCHETVKPLIERASAESPGFGAITLPEGCREEEGVARARESAPPSAPRIRFRNLAAEAGVDFHHLRDQTLFNLGGGAAAGDYNGDGLLDIYVTNSAGSNGLYRNNGDGTFTDVAAGAGVADPTGRGNAAGWGDYDNDGDLDLFVANYGSSKLFSNGGDGTFADVTAAAGVGDPDGEYRTMGVAWGDYDRDGRIDLLVVRHVSEADHEVFKTRQFASAVRSLALFHNDGDGAFTNVTHLLGDATAYPSNVKGAGFRPTFMDYDNDGDQDIYVVNDFGRENHPNVLWRNDGADAGGGWRFTDVSEAAGVNLATFGMGLAVGDHDNDGDLDFYVTDCGDSDFLVNRGDGTFVEVTPRTGTARGSIAENFPVDLSFGWGAAFVDVDNDGLLDLYYVAGQMDTDVNINRAHQPNALFYNQGDGTFVDISETAGADDPRGGRDVVPGDFNNDGLPDLFVVNMGTADGAPGVASLYLNESDSTHHWLSIKLVGTTSNRDGLGARINVTAGGRTQIREMGVSQGHNSHSVTPVYFGLGEATRAELVEVRWPSGEVQTLSEVAADQLLTLTEPLTTTIDIGFTTTCFPAVMEDNQCWIVPPSLTIDQGFSKLCDGVLNPFTGGCVADCNPLTSICTSGNFVDRCFGAESGGVCYSLIPGPPISAEYSPFTTCLGTESGGRCYSSRPGPPVGR